MKTKLVEEIDSRWDVKDLLMMTSSVYITAAVIVIVSSSYLFWTMKNRMQPKQQLHSWQTD